MGDTDSGSVRWTAASSRGARIVRQWGADVGVIAEDRTRLQNNSAEFALELPVSPQTQSLSWISRLTALTSRVRHNTRQHANALLRVRTVLFAQSTVASDRSLQ